MRPVVVVVVVFFSWAGAWTVPPHGARAASARHSFKGGLPDPTKDDGTAERIAQAEKEMWESFSPAQRTVKTAERAALKLEALDIEAFRRATPQLVPAHPDSKSGRASVSSPPIALSIATPCRTAGKKQRVRS